MVIIPIKDLASFIETIVLEEVVYQFKFFWNTRDEAWYLDISDQEGEPILYGLKIVINYELIGRFTDTRLPLGIILIVDIEGASERLERDDFEGERLRLVYVTEAEVESGSI